MYKTLAFRNMKRQLRNYLIYFVTIAMTISLVFAMNNMIYNEDLQARAESFASLSVGLLVLSSFLCVIIAVVLGYANAFMLKLRKREFGTYLTLGMKRHQIVKLFLLENSFLGIFAILAGFVFGSLLYQGLMLLMSALLDYDFSFSFVSMKGVVVTLIMAVAIFAVTFVTSSFYLRRVTIFELIHGEKQVNKVQRKPIFSVVLTVVSAVAIIYAFYHFSIHLEGVFIGYRIRDTEAGYHQNHRERTGAVGFRGVQSIERLQRYQPRNQTEGDPEGGRAGIFPEHAGAQSGEENLQLCRRRDPGCEHGVRRNVQGAEQRGEGKRSEPDPV